MPDARTRAVALAAALAALPAWSAAQGPPAPSAADGYEACWRSAGALIAEGQRYPDDSADPARAAAYAGAAAYARRAIAVRPDGADGHFMLAQALARGSLGRGRRERIAAAEEIHREALRAIQLDPRHDGAYHVLGRWHAQIMRLSGLQRLVARRLLGGGSFGEASWDEAVANLRTAVALAPRRITHRLDLAEVLLDREQTADAALQLDAALSLPEADPLDPVYKQRARALRGRIAPRAAEGSR
jgi:tetratricopeptide (TPR) repeat protein